MPPSKSEEKIASNKPSRKKRDRATEIADTFEWLITAFILAFVFRAFVMEAFRIPTGSMADTLKGAHFRLRCVQCGYKYEHGFIPRDYRDSSGHRLREDTVPGDRVPPPRTRCPSCGNYPLTGDKVPVSNGDRILVLKCIYQFFEPKRWDVIVFKNPNEPHINYIKRLIAVPGDELQIIDGDVYIDGKISRKPPKVQNELWMPVYDNDYQPVDPDIRSFNNHAWVSPFKMSNSEWKIDKTSPTLFHLDSPPDQINTMSYETSAGNSFRATYAYNNVDYYSYRPYCSDLMVRFYLRPASTDGRIGIDLSKYKTNYRAWVELGGKMVIAKVSGGEETILASKEIEPAAAGKWSPAEFANVDHQLIFKFGSEKISYDLGREPEDAGQREINIEPQAKIFGSGTLTLSHVAIFRDIHYTSGGIGGGNGRAVGEAFVLAPDEFFVLGDNSPNSQDSRWWTEPGVVSKGRKAPRAGIVPRYYLVGKALFVYWPSGFRPFAKFPVGAIPNVGQMRFIYGGSDKTQ